MRKLLYYIMVSILFVACCGTRHIKEVPVQTITKDSIYYNVIHKDTTVYHHIKADTIKASQNVNLDTFGTFRDTLSILDNNYSISMVELIRKSQNEFAFNHLLIQKKLDIAIPVKFVYLDKYVTKYELKEVPVEVKVEVPIRDKLFWISIICNVIVVMIIIIKARFRRL